MSANPGRIVGVIPARWGSTRFPGKALVPIAGIPLVVRVLQRVRQSDTLDRLVVATDDERIRDVVIDAGGDVVMTRSDHPSGTDRVAEAAVAMDADIVINIQGDEPLIDPLLVDRLGAALAEDPSWDMATAAAPFAESDEIESPDLVKVVWGESGQALYFSRSVIPHERGAESLNRDLFRRHIGIYAYRHAFLEKLVATPPCALEETEKLEQLRALFLGGRMKVIFTSAAGVGVDSPEDVPRAEAALRAAGLV